MVSFTKNVVWGDKAAVIVCWELIIVEEEFVAHSVRRNLVNSLCLDLKPLSSFHRCGIIRTSLLSEVECVSKNGFTTSQIIPICVGKERHEGHSPLCLGLIRVINLDVRNVVNHSRIGFLCKSLHFNSCVFIIHR